MGNTTYKVIDFNKVDPPQSGEFYNSKLVISTYSDEEKTKLKNKDELNFIEVYNSYEKYRNEILSLGLNDSVEIPFCVMNEYNTIDHCKAQFGLSPDDSFYKKYLFSVSKKDCNSLAFRRGTIVSDSNKAKLDSLVKTDGYYLKGKYCKVTNIDYFYDDDILKNCCLMKDKINCNKKLTNDYITTHCNIVMNKYCKIDPTSKICFNWLVNSNIRGDEIAYQTYSEICSDNMQLNVCDYFVELITGDQPLTVYSDYALDKYCNNNSLNPKCKCYLNNINKNYDSFEYYGPKECWTEECVNLDDKWLSSIQKELKKKCKMIECTIRINEIDGNSGHIEAINDCVNINKVESSVNDKTINDNNNTKYTPKIVGSMFSSFTLLFIIILFIILNLLFNYFYILYIRIFENNLNIFKFI